MSKLKMLKFEAAALQQNAKSLMEGLQRLGVAELKDIEDERLFASSASESAQIYETSINQVSLAMDTLSEYGISCSGGMFSGRTALDEKEYLKMCAEVNGYVKTAYKINELKKSIADNKAEIVRCETSRSSLKIWESLDVPMSGASTENAVCFVGTLNGEYTREKILTKLAEIIPEIKEYDVEIVCALKEITSVVFLCHKDCEKELVSAVRSIGFTAPSEMSAKPVKQRVDEYEEKIKTLTNAVEHAENKLRGMKDEAEKLKFAYDYFTVKYDEYSNLSKAAFSESSIVLSGYVPEKYADKLIKTVEKLGGAAVVCEPDENDENVPVALSNGGFAEPVEGITEMYALPGKHDIDPSGVMAFFYYLLFGMMLSDAGYGVLMTLGTWFILKKTGVEGSMRRTMKMFFYCGISTTIWGALFGSWFGDIVGVICTNFLGYETAPSLALWFEPIKDPIKLLLFSFIIGICHLFLGLIVFGVMQWRQGDKVSAVLDTVPIMMTVLGAAPLAGSILAPGIPPVVMEIAKCLAIAGVVLIVLTNSRSSKNILARLGGGLYGLYNIASGYLSDILSYSRLLALGLATGSIASVVNMMGSMVENPVLKGILLTVVFIVGHTLNMAINVLGAYVHTNRLQFVELFSKFYEGGGRAFQPLKFNTKFFKFKEENDNV